MVDYQTKPLQQKYLKILALLTHCCVMEVITFLFFILDLRKLFILLCFKRFLGAKAPLGIARVKKGDEKVSELNDFIMVVK